MVEVTSLYVDLITGNQITTNSMIKTFRRCPKQAEYKYFRRLKPVVLSKPLTRGKWMHSLLEAYYKGGDWEAVHKRLTNKFAKLFDEEKDHLGDLPRECYALMKSYLWHYKFHEWNVIGVEQKVEAQFPDGTIYRLRYDLLVEDEYGLWMVDHKNLGRMPNFSSRLKDTQSALYVWAARQQGLNVQGFIWNYLKTTGIKKPALLKDGSRLSRVKISTDYPTYARAILEYNLNPKDYSDTLRYLKNQRFAWGEPQTSEFFHRSVLERDDYMLEGMAMEAYHTSMRMHDYNFAETRAVERVIDRSCDFMCS